MLKNLSSSVAEYLKIPKDLDMSEFNTKLVTTWADAAQANPVAIQSAREQKMAEMELAGKTDGLRLTNEVGTVVERFFIDAAAANEWSAFFQDACVAANIPAPVSMQVIDLGA